MDYLEAATRIEEKLVGWRRDIHMHPELGFEEHRTAALVEDHLRSLDMRVQAGVAGTGVVGILEGNQTTPVVLLRFDMDALPIQEKSDAPYASTNPGVMHACGHDGHVAIGLGVAEILASRRGDLAGSVKFVFQPAEEGLGGAKRMVSAGALEDPNPDYALGLHLWNEHPLGWLGLTDGPIFAAAELMEIIVTGSGGHGAMPHQTRDPVVASAHLVAALQTIVSREVDPLDAAVVSVTGLRAGETHNVIPHQANIRGTIRTFDEGIREHVIKRVNQLCLSIAKAFGCEAQVSIKKLTPPVVNDPRLTRIMIEVAGEIVPAVKVDEEARTTGSEDVAYLMEGIPSCYVLLGSSDPERGRDAVHHHHRFDFDEGALVLGSALMAAATHRLLEES